MPISVVVGMSLSTGSFTSRCFGELYNVTDFVSIANTQLESNRDGEASREYIFSGNFIDDLPDHRISLALRIRSEVAGTVASGGSQHISLFIEILLHDVLMVDKSGFFRGDTKVSSEFRLRT